ncbi:hypothetical protein IWX49DRAFT_569665 [Phyllosticta citricarpa]|uniref:Uncharacterized protein n=1 Tax=Phyllosticta citricarpa TaxID=55181 RepID=A0ABR1LBM8_9PEZI
MRPLIFALDSQLHELLLIRRSQGVSMIARLRRHQWSLECSFSDIFLEPAAQYGVLKEVCSADDRRDITSGKASRLSSGGLASKPTDSVVVRCSLVQKEFCSSKLNRIKIFLFKFPVSLEVKCNHQTQQPPDGLAHEASLTMPISSTFVVYSKTRNKPFAWCTSSSRNKVFPARLGCFQYGGQFHLQTDRKCGSGTLQNAASPARKDDFF